MRPPAGSAVDGRDASELHRFRVGEESVSVDRVSTTGLFGKARESASWVGNSLLVPAVLIPAPPRIHSPGFTSFAQAFDAIDHLVVRGRAGEIHAPQHIAESEEVGVRVDDSRDDGLRHADR